MAKKQNIQKDQVQNQIDKQKKKQKKLKIALGVTIPTAAVVGFILGWWIPQINPFNPIDKSLLDKINSLLKQSKWCNTMDQTVELLYDNNIDITSIYPSDADQEYVWDQDVNQYVIIDGKTGQAKCWSRGYKLNPKKNHLWKMVNPSSFDVENEYAQYLREGNYSSHLSDDGYMQFVSGIDAGLNKAINFEYKGDANGSVTVGEDANDTPVVNTNYGHLRINGPLNSVRHYGIAQTLTISKLDKTYYERGTIIGDVIVTGGTFVADEGSIVNTIVVADASAKVEVNNGSAVGSYGALEEGWLDNVKIDPTMPPSEIPTNVGEVETPDPGEPYLHGMGTQESPYIVSTREDLDLMPSYYDGETYQYFMFAGPNDHIDCSGWAENHHNAKFIGEFDGNGVVLENLDDCLFRVVGEAIESEEEPPIPLRTTIIKNITINNVCIDAMDYVGIVARSVGNKTRFENIVVHGYAMGTGVGGFVGFGATNLLPNYGKPYTFTKITFKNCINDAMLIASDLAAGFIYQPAAETVKSCANSEIIIEDSIFNGKMCVPQTISKVKYGRMNYFLSWGYSSAANRLYKIKTHYSESFIKEYGNPAEGENPKYIVNSPTKEGDFDCFGACGCSSSLEPSEGVACDFYYPNEDPELVQTHKNYLEVDQPEEEKDWLDEPTTEADVKSYPIKKVENATKIIFWLSAGPNGKNLGDPGNFVGTYLTDSIDVAKVAVGAEVTSGIVKSYIVRINHPGVTETGINEDGIHFDIVNEYFGTTKNSYYLGAIQVDDQNRGFKLHRIPFKIVK